MILLDEKLNLSYASGRFLCLEYRPVIPGFLIIKRR